MKICVFGLWHLGSVIATSLADLGNSVVGLDFNEEVIEKLQNANAPVSESGLNKLILDNLERKTLTFTNDPRFALQDAEILWIAFDTPVDEKDIADVSYIEKKFEIVAPFINNEMKIIISSQVPVGFTRYLQNQFYKKNPGKKVYFAYSPENLRLGKALKTFLKPDRIVIGTNSDEKELFLPVFSLISDRLEWMSIESAEMTKHAINAFLATSICFANEVATLCECLGADAKDVERGLKTEERIGQKAYLNPGNAFSGGTLARDVRFLQTMGKENFLTLHLINSVLESNDLHKTWIRRKCLDIMGELEGKHIAVLGLTYKPGTNTLRRSMSVELCRWLKNKGVEVTAFDPAIQELPLELHSIISLSSDIASAVEDADCVIIATEWSEFQKVEKEIITTIRAKMVIDPNGFMERTLENIHTMQYFAVGRSYS